ncbi:MAG: AmmeMemoRadiSam system radical SAM enzyme [Chloroflexi bacterium]|nr:AmmeMemoRadiSam system radical SAM enzyme [Chloroflexota bacterium]
MDFRNEIDSFTCGGTLFSSLKGKTIRCAACAHRCEIPSGKRGFCKVRYNENGDFRVPYGYVAGIQIDPIEKKPLAHFFPGSDVLTFGMLGCNFHCSFCQNWFSSQSFRDPDACSAIEKIHPISPEEIVDLAIRNQVTSIASSYNEPLISSEWAVEVFKIAKQKGIKTVFVSNGFATEEVFSLICPWLDAIKIDLKSMREERYRQMGGKLQPVLDSIRNARAMGLWVEVVTLVIPDFNDSPEELWDAGRYLASISVDIPWHVTAYHPDYKMCEGLPTSSELLQRAAEIGQEAGLRYVYAGNIPGKVGSLEDTCCPKCNQQLVRRRGYRILENKLTAEGICPYCGETIAGLFL